MNIDVDVQAKRLASWAVARLAKKAAEAHRLLQLRDKMRPAIPTVAAKRILEQLNSDQIAAVSRYVASADLEHLATQLAVMQLTGSSKAKEEISVVVRDQVRHGLRLFAHIPDDQLFGVTDIVFDALLVGCQVACADVQAAGGADHIALAASGHVVAMAARNTKLLSDLASLASIHEDAEQLRNQILEVHGVLRIPHTGVSRNAPWHKLYVVPSMATGSGNEVATEQDHDEPPSIDHLIGPGRRSVLLGDPGAGKTTFVAKLAHDIAESKRYTPFLVVLRELAESLRFGEMTLVDQLAAACKNPYNVYFEHAAIEYLLLNGHAVVILDGFDELTDIARRTQTARLVESFAAMYPLTPLIVTSRRIGYDEVALDRRMFSTYSLLPFDTPRVIEYATNWFQLDGTAPAQDRVRLRTEFLDETSSISDLRRSPLLLSLLCAMYAAARFIPRNRAQVYERCALMVFEQWDTMRGIRMPLRFQGHVRGAIQRLAWQMFSNERTELTESKVAQTLAEFLIEKHFDADEAARLAEEFLAFCAGRAWVLTEVGSTEAERIYGFAHRTFLEYFAAEYLVRRHPSAEGVRQLLSSKIGVGAWEVVAQICLQLLDRNVDGGADELLGLLMDERESETAAPDRISFIARATTHLGLTPRTLHNVGGSALGCFMQLSESDRMCYWGDANLRQRCVSFDDALHVLIAESLDGNIPHLLRGVGEALAEAIVDGNDTAMYLTYHLQEFLRGGAERDDRWRNLCKELAQGHQAEYVKWSERRPWSLLRDCLDSDHAVDRLFKDFGPESLYLSISAFGSLTLPTAVRAVAGHRSIARPARTVRLLRDRLIGQPGPWLKGGQLAVDANDGEDVFEIYSGFAPTNAPPLTTNGEDLGALLVLYLPYLEAAARNSSGARVSTLGVPGAVLVDGRAQTNEGAEMYLERWMLPQHVGDFLARWIRREFSVIA